MGKLEFSQFEKQEQRIRAPLPKAFVTVGWERVLYISTAPPMTDRKGKVNELDYVKIRRLCSVRDTGNSVGRQMTYVEMIFAKYDS